MANKKKFNEAIDCFRKALQIDPTFEIARLNLEMAIEELAHDRNIQSATLTVINENGKYFLQAEDDLLKTPNGNVIDANSPELLDAIISDFSGQGEIIVEDGILLQPRCMSAYALASSAIDFFTDNDLSELPEWLNNDMIFSPTAGHPVVATCQLQPKAELFFKEKNIPLKVRESYKDNEWQKVISFLQEIVGNFTAPQKSALVNLAWPHEYQFVTTIMYLIGLYNEREWAESIFSQTDDVCEIIGDMPIGNSLSMPDELSEEERQEEINDLIEEIMEDVLIAKRYLEITKE